MFFYVLHAQNNFVQVVGSIAIFSFLWSYNDLFTQNFFLRYPKERTITLLLNESVVLERDGARIHLAGIDDPHYYQVDNFDKATTHISPEELSILLSHSPETYRHAAHADFDLMLSGHTHGGQICLPGGIALMTNADCPRRFCRGAWRHHAMQGYTSTGSGASVVGVRYNCPPEITLHRLKVQPDQ